MVRNTATCIEHFSNKQKSNDGTFIDGYIIRIKSQSLTDYGYKFMMIINYRFFLLSIDLKVNI